MMRIIILIFTALFTFHCSNTALAQKYANSKFYLVDSLDLNLIEKQDKILLDSCLKVYHSTKIDTTRMLVLKYIAENAWDEFISEKYTFYIYKYIKPLLNKPHLYSKNEISLLREIFYIANGDVGFYFNYKGDFDSALKYFEIGMKYEKETNNIQDLATTINNIGSIYMDKGLLSQAIDNYIEALSLFEQVSDTNGMAMTNNNIGYIFKKLNDLEVSERYFKKAKKFFQIANNKAGVASAINNIGNIYERKKEYTLALSAYKETLILVKEANEKNFEGRTYNNIGRINFLINNYDTAIAYFEQSKSLLESIEDKTALSHCLSGLAYAYLKTNQIEKAEKTALLSNKISNEIDIPVNKSESCKVLSDIYFAKKEYKKAWEYYNQYSIIKDSVFNDNNNKLLLQKEANYKYNKQKEIDEISHKKELEIQSEKQKKQVVIIVLSLVALIIIAVLLLVIYRRLQLTKIQKKIIEEQKEEVEAQRDEIHLQREILQEKNTEINDSINAAFRIQKTLLTYPENFIKKLPDNFIFFKPLSTLSGDFYWFYLTENHIFIAVADCTGHGVPGSLMSMLGISYLNEILQKNPDTTPSDILDNLRDKIVAQLNQSKEIGSSKEGMDISLIKVNLDFKTLEWAGANNNLYLIQNDNILTEIKADRQPIGYSSKSVPFNNHKFNIKPNDTFYLFSDGFADQFGGINKKKLGYNNFKNILINIYSLPIDEQKNTLEQKFEEWRILGNEEQLDDVCVIGLKF